MRYFVCAIHTTDLCGYFCPSLLSKDMVVIPAFLEKWFALQAWLLRIDQTLLGGHGTLIFPNLILAPLVEESLYRGPLFLLKDRLSSSVWWFLAVFLGVIFILSHRSFGLTIFPLLVLGLLSSWLVFKTGRLWPSISLHFLYNFQVVSLPYYQSMLWGN